MKRDFELFIDDILNSIRNIEKFAKGLNKGEFLKDILKQSAIIRQVEIIGESVKNIPKNFKDKYKGVEWAKISGTGDKMIHKYFDVDLDVLWNIIKNDLPKLKKQIEKIKKELNSEN
jgi:uncharacterized protein with HEPN domain